MTKLSFIAITLKRKSITNRNCITLILIVLFYILKEKTIFKTKKSCRKKV